MGLDGRFAELQNVFVVDVYAGAGGCVASNTLLVPLEPAGPFVCYSMCPRGIAAVQTDDLSSSTAY